MLNEMDAAQVCEVLDPRLHLLSIALLKVDDRVCFPHIVRLLFLDDSQSNKRANPKLQSKTIAVCAYIIFFWD